MKLAAFTEFNLETCGNSGHVLVNIVKKSCGHPVFIFLSKGIQESTVGKQNWDTEGY